ncbi:MAG: hypothetical protein R3264_08950, partial [Anaerolineae bacterium]|nr:hypothetical protein [Anaerolineae bacterium]
GGPQRAIGEDVVTAAIALALNSPFGIAASYRYVQEGRYTDTIYLGAYRRDTIEQAGFFDEKFVRNQDYEFNYRVRQKVGKLFCAPDVELSYIGRPSLKSLWRQYWQFGFWKTRTIWKHPESLKLRHLIAPAFVAGLGLSGVGLFFAPLRFLFPAILSLYLVANLAACLTQFRNGPLKVVGLLPIIFGLIHLGWGSGFLWGGLTLLGSRSERLKFGSTDNGELRTSAPAVWNRSTDGHR